MPEKAKESLERSYKSIHRPQKCWKVAKHRSKACLGLRNHGGDAKT